MEPLEFVGTSTPLGRILGGEGRLTDRLRDLRLTLLVVDVRNVAGTFVNCAIEDVLPELTPEQRARLKDRTAFLLLDHSHEGIAHRPHISERIHAWCALNEIPLDQLIFSGSNEVYAEHYEAWREEAGEAEGYHYFLFSSYAFLLIRKIQSIEWNVMRGEFLRPKTRPYLFLNYNYAPRAARLLVARHLLSADPSDALVSLGAQKASDSQSLKMLASEFRRGALAEDYGFLFDDIDIDDLRARTTLQTVVSPDKSADLVNLATTIEPEDYFQTYISVVTETEMSSGDVTRITEKTLKPFLFGHLAIVAGNRNSLHLVREMGFDTYGDVLDESYDTMEDPSDRLHAVLKQIDHIRELGMDAVREMFRETRETRATNLHFGRRHLQGRMEQTANIDMLKLIEAVRHR